MGLDHVELLMCWEDSFDIDIPETVAISISTVDEAINALTALLGASDRPGPCLSQRAFYRLRRDLLATGKLKRAEIHPDSKLRARFLGLGVYRVRDEISWCIATKAHQLLSAEERWTRRQISTVIHTSLNYLFNITEVRGRDHFIKDLGLG